MYLKSLTISRGDGTVVRNILFRLGLNLIIDETPATGNRETGNNVGKTTVLKLIDFCLGADKREIYIDPENRRNEYKLVKDYLVENEILISLVLKDDFRQAGLREVLIERNFLSYAKKVQQINGIKKTDDEFEEELTDLLFPGHYDKKPTFRQIIAHNIRYRDISVNNTLKNLNQYTSDAEYETLYLFLLGCDFEQGDTKQRLLTLINVEERLKSRLEAEQTKSGYESALSILQLEIEALETQKESLNLNPNFETNLNRLNQVKSQINLIISELGRLEIRKSLIQEAQEEMIADKSAIDLQQLEQIYQQATTLVSGIQKTFSELNNFHNQMVESKLRFIMQDLPKIDTELNKKQEQLQQLRQQEAELSAVVTRSDSFESLEKLITELNEKYRLKGTYQNALTQIEQVDAQLGEYKHRLAEIDDKLFSDEYAITIQEQVNKFNKYFSSVSNELYGEKYALKFDTKINKRGQRLYEFTAFNMNFSSGKKQGEISCFDIAYTLFADEEGIPCMHFLLNDKKELMHDNQLVRIADLVDREGIQFVASILKDKLPPELNKPEYVVVRLSQQDKLFRIES